ncbi:hypothetical protein OB2597_07555 [Pseudooceanicola batsensis HTCC2597]|uniref:DUF304 domain-containing protein n=1 Tax=Pseudooceanicola batsensis (strain ATCC BAA-863 / DSM 15984 / KCTC 12145 / HTCC2597) TaxID=252305 RepID=A3TTZ6_PSEBH|nr:hypothetical protein [Pseudooceanicola batsensis]EAQ05123.1 hypothetical protein OB2597_07555 [Pseudooceanicola batsensis HTCC2597]
MSPSLFPGERIVARRPTGLGLFLAVALLTGTVAFAAEWLTAQVIGWNIRQSLVPASALALVAALAAQATVRRKLSYCLTTRRLILGTGRQLPLDAVARCRIGAHSLTVEDREARQYRIAGLLRPAWLATRINRCRAGGVPETGICAT